jgi:hypothetical protein
VILAGQVVRRQYADEDCRQALRSLAPPNRRIGEELPRIGEVGERVRPLRVDAHLRVRVVPGGVRGRQLGPSGTGRRTAAFPQQGPGNGRLAARCYGAGEYSWRVSRSRCDRPAAPDSAALSP